MSTELKVAYERIARDNARFRQMREWLVFGADDMATCLDLIDAALDERVAN
jgi:hypothetical protein